MAAQVVTGAVYHAIYVFAWADRRRWLRLVVGPPTSVGALSLLGGVEWVSPSAIRPNGYNPNVQHGSVRALLRLSLEVDGWTSPLLCAAPDAEGIRELVDGEQRWAVAVELGWLEVPVVTLRADRVGRLASSVRHNRARGHQQVAGTVAVLRELLGSGLSELEVGALLGMGELEVKKLLVSESRFLAIQAGEDAL